MSPSHTLFTEMSRLNIFRLVKGIHCGLKYRFQDMDLIPKILKSSGLVFTSIVHSTIELFHKERKIGKQISLEMLFKILDTDWFCQKLDNEMWIRRGREKAFDKGNQLP